MVKTAQEFCKGKWCPMGPKEEVMAEHVDRVVKRFQTSVEIDNFFYHTSWEQQEELLPGIHNGHCEYSWSRVHQWSNQYAEYLGKNAPKKVVAKEAENPWYQPFVEMWSGRKREN